MMRPAAEKGVVSRVDLIRLERQANDLTGELEVARLSVPRLRAAEREVKQKADQYVADFRAQASRELSEARADQSVVSATKVALEDRLDRTLVRAPVAGTVKQVKVNTVGGVVQPGMDLVEIVPIDDTLLVEARVRPADIAFLRPGLPAMVKLSAYDFSIYGGIDGTVEHISADAIVDDRPGARPESLLPRARAHAAWRSRRRRSAPEDHSRHAGDGRHQDRAQDGAAVPAEADPARQADGTAGTLREQTVIVLASADLDVSRPVASGVRRRCGARRGAQFRRAGAVSRADAASCRHPRHAGCRVRARHAQSISC